MVESMEIYPLDWPRLSGVLWYGPPHRWEIINTEDGIQIIPAKTPRGLMMFFVILGLAIVAGTQLVMIWQVNFPDKGLALLGSVVVALGLIIGCIFLHVTFSREQARGPILVISLLKKEAYLPREGKSWPFDRILNWEIVHGTWVRVEHEKPKLFDEVSELQMVIMNDTGEKSAWPIIGAMGRHDRVLYAAAEKIAMKTNLPLLVTKS